MKYSIHQLVQPWSAIARFVKKVEPPLEESEINGLLVKQCQARRRNAKQKLNTTKP
jgi:hypothetical protein